MKLKLISFLLFITASFCTLFGQNTKSDMEVIYKMKFIADSLKKDNVTYVDNLTLLFNNEISIYYSQEAKDYYDYLNKGISKMQGGKISLGTLPPYPKSKGSVYKSGDIITATLPVGKYLYSFEEPKLNWTLLEDRTEINGIKCSLAKTKSDTGDTFFAWYTSEYPVSEGPFRFKGLPGLIVKVYNANNTIEIETVQIKKVEKEIEPFFNKSALKIKNKEAFLKARNEYFDNPNIQNMNTGLIIKDGNGNILNSNTRKVKLGNNVFLD
jgi:GLPGLI family protein